MKTVCILAFNKTVSITALAAHDVFQTAGVLWNTFTDSKPQPLFKVEVATPDGKPVRFMNNLTVQSDRSVVDVEQADIIIIPSVWDIDWLIKKAPFIVEWLRKMHGKGSILASVCTGAFLLAETGLLNGKQATTHWGMVELFRKRYPEVSLKIDRIIVDEGSLFCAAGGSAGLDLSLYLVDMMYGHQVAVQSAKAILHDLGRNSQKVFSASLHQRNHDDSKILIAQKWIEETFDKNMAVGELAALVGMSRRSFERKFKRITGETPLGYQQGERIEYAKRLIETGGRSFEQIAYEVGYEDPGHFRKLFTRKVGVNPRVYRKKFGQTVHS